MDKSNIAAKIRALLSKTVENGCTEAEAMIAMTKAREMMDAHNLTATEVEVEAEGVEDWYWKDAPHEAVYILRNCSLGSRIGTYCEVKYWNHGEYASVYSKRASRKPRMFGFEGDIVFAKWLAKTLTSTIIRDWKSYSKTQPKERRTSYFRNSFFSGASDRIRARMREEIEARDAARSGLVGTGLVVVDRKSVISRKLGELGFKFKSAPVGGAPADARAHGAGERAGDRARWDRPVNGGKTVLAIGAK